MIITRQTNAAEKSAMGMEYKSPSIPKNIGSMKSKGRRKMICLVRDRKTPFFGMPIAVKKLEVIGCMKKMQIRNRQIRTYLTPMLIP